MLAIRNPILALDTGSCSLYRMECLGHTMPAGCRETRELKPSILLLGWNQSTVSALHALCNANLAPARVIAARGFDSSLLKIECDRRMIPITETDRTYSFSKLAHKYDLLASVSWPFIIPHTELANFSLGAINLHASKLPEYRGVHPLNWALIHDAQEIGVTVHFLSAEVDAGDILLQETLKICDQDSLQEIREWVFYQGGQLIVNTIRGLVDASIKPVPQNSEFATPAPRRKPEDGEIDWRRTAREIFCLIRGVSYPSCGAFSRLNGQKVVIWHAREVLRDSHSLKQLPGTVLCVSGESVQVQTGKSGVLDILRYDGPTIKTFQRFEPTLP